MPHIYADRVEETTTTTGTGTLNLAGATTGNRTFVAGVGSTNTCTFCILDANGTAWEVSSGTVTDATPDTLSRTLIASSTGSLISLSAGTHTVYLVASARHATQSVLEQVTGTDANTTMQVGQMYVVDMSAWATADRTYTLPATAIVGDRIGIMVSAGDASHELIITANTGDTLNGIAGGTEWSRLFITGEVVIMRCIAANATWIVENDYRIPQKGALYLTTDATGETLQTWTDPTTKSGVWTALYDVGSICSTTGNRITVRRAGKYLITLAAVNNSQFSAADKRFGCRVTRSDASTVIHEQVNYHSIASGFLDASGVTVDNLVADDYVFYQFFSDEGSRGLNSAIGMRSSFSATELIP